MVPKYVRLEMEGSRGVQRFEPQRNDTFLCSNIVRSSITPKMVIDMYDAMLKNQFSDIVGEERPNPIRAYQMKDTARLQRGLAASSNLTENQLLFWIGYKLQPNVPIETHAIRFAFTIEDAIDPDHFQRALQKLVDRADSLRTVVREIDMVPMRQVAERLPFTVDYVRYSDEPDPDAAFRGWADVKLRTPLSSEAPFESALIELGPRRFTWYLALHHVISDARTVYLIAQHVSLYYQLSFDGKLETAPPLPTFEDYVTYDRAYRSSEAYRKAAAHWVRKLSDSPKARQSGTPMAPANRSGSPRQKLRTERLSHELRREQTSALQELVRREVLISPAVPFLTMFFLTLAHIRGWTRPLTIGTPFLNRPDRFLGTIGLFVSTCPLVLRIDEKDSFLALARKIQSEFIRASAHQNYPVQNPVHGRIFEAFFNYLNVQFSSFAGRNMLIERLRSGYSNNSLSLSVRDFGASGRFTLDFEFQRQEFAPEHQQEAIAYLLKLLDAFLDDPSQTVSSFL